MKVQKLGKKYYFNHEMIDFRESDITDFKWTENSGVKIIISTWEDAKKRVQINYQFYKFNGFRYLDESDLLRYVQNSDFHGGHHLYEILEGGWNSGEVVEVGIMDMSKNIKQLKEFFILTTNGCMSILTFEEPKIKEVDLKYQDQKS